MIGVEPLSACPPSQPTASVVARTMPNLSRAFARSGHFRHGMDVAREAKIRKISEGACAEPAGILEPVDLVCSEAQILEELERLLKAGGHQESALRGKLTHEELKYRRLSLATGEISSGLAPGSIQPSFTGGVVHGRCSFSPALYRSAVCFLIIAIPFY